MAKKPPRYEWNGMPVNSVTEILSLLNKPALVPWAAKCTADKFSDILAERYHNEHAYVIPLDDIANVLKEAKSAHRGKQKEALEVGTQVHNAIEEWIRSSGNMKAEEIVDERVRMGLEGFLAWGESRDIEIIDYEQKVYGWETTISEEKGHPPLFAGRFDLLAKVDGLITLIDFKTNKGAEIWPENWLQVNAYARALQQSDYRQAPDYVGVLSIDKETGNINYQSQACDTDLYMQFWHLAQAKRLMGDKKNGN